jgi:hypothetical protein
MSLSLSPSREKGAKPGGVFLLGLESGIGP